LDRDGKDLTKPVKEIVVFVKDSAETSSNTPQSSPYDIENTFHSIAFWDYLKSDTKQERNMLTVSKRKLKEELIDMLVNDMFVLAHPHKNGVFLVATADHYGIRSTDIVFVNAKPDYVKSVMDKLNDDPFVERFTPGMLIFADIPPLLVTDSFTNEAKDVAPILLSFQLGGFSEIVEDMCAHSYQGHVGSGGEAIDALLDVEYDEFPDDVTAPLNVQQVSEWAAKLVAHDNQNVEAFGHAVEENIRWYKNHDVDGNILDDDGRIIGHLEDKVREAAFRRKYDLGTDFDHTAPGIASH
jgi:hypothetical protein